MSVSQDQGRAWWSMLSSIFANNDVENSTILSSGRTAIAVTTAAVATSIPTYYLVQRILHQRRRRRLQEENKDEDTSLLSYPPGPKPLPFIGNLLDIYQMRQKGYKHPDLMMLEWSKTYGLVITLHLPVIGRLIFVMDPKLVKQMTVTKNYPKPTRFNFIHAVLGKTSMVVVNGQEWASKRRAFKGGFGPSFLKNVVNAVSSKMKRMIQAIDDDVQNQRVSTMLSRAQIFTSDVIVTVAFGEDWGGTEIHPARALLDVILCIMADFLFNPMSLILNPINRWRLRQYEKMLDTEMMNILERRLLAAATAQEQHQQSSNGGGQSSSANDICSLAIEAIRKENADGTLTDEDKISITHQLKTFYVAGHETTALLISWTIWMLGRRPDIATKIRKELKDKNISADPTTKDASSPPTYDQLQECVYLEAVLKESLRMYTPGGGPRYAPDGETYNGHYIGGTPLFVSFLGMHRNPLLWKDPEMYRPERFLDGSEDNIQDKFVPFMRGPRDCIGKYFAMLEAKLAVAALITRYDVKCINHNEEIIQMLTTQPKEGAQVRFHPRKT